MATPSMTPEEIRQKIEQLSSDIALLRGFVHGDEQTTVPLGGEDTNSLRRFMMLAQDGVDGPIERSRQWAENPEGVPVAGPGHFSALHWATKAMESATGTADVPTASPLQRGLAPAGGLANQVYRVNADGNGYGWETGLATPARAGFVPAGGAAGQVFWVNEAGDGYEWGSPDVTQEELDAALAGKLDTSRYEEDAPMRIVGSASVSSTGLVTSADKITSVTRTAVGTYIVNCSAVKSVSRIWAAHKNPAQGVVAMASYSSDGVALVRTYTSSGNLADGAFEIFVLNNI